MNECDKPCCVRKLECPFCTHKFEGRVLETEMCPACGHKIRWMMEHDYDGEYIVGEYWWADWRDE